MEAISGRFAGEIIEDADEPTGSHVGDVLDDPTPEVVAEPVFEPTPPPAPTKPIFLHQPEPEPEETSTRLAFDPFAFTQPVDKPAKPAPVSAFTHEEPAPVAPAFVYDEPDLSQTAPEPTPAAEPTPRPVEDAPEASHSEPAPVAVVEPQVAHPQEPTALPSEPVVNPAAFTQRVQNGPTAVGVAPQTTNLFADEALAETPVAKGPAKNRKAGVATRTKKADPAVTGAITADALANARPRTMFDDPDAHMEPTVTEEDRLPPKEEKPRRVKPDGSPTFGQRIREVGEKIGHVGFGSIVGLIVGLLAAGYVVATFGPWQATDLGFVTRNLDAPVNALPAGTAITMTRPGEVKATGTGTLFPIALQSAKATVLGPIENGGQVVGYTVECTGGSCAPGLVFDIPIESILGKG